MGSLSKSNLCSNCLISYNRASLRTHHTYTMYQVCRNCRHRCARCRELFGPRKESKKVLCATCSRELAAEFREKLIQANTQSILRTLFPVDLPPQPLPASFPCEVGHLRSNGRNIALAVVRNLRTEFNGNGYHATIQINDLEELLIVIK